ncbi:NAD kinase 2 mitochondrial, partial [Paragonimus heterotremus]
TFSVGSLATFILRLAKRKPFQCHCFSSACSHHITKFDFERSLEQHTDDEQLRKALLLKGINVDWLVKRHNAHYQKVSEFQRFLKLRGLEVHLVDRSTYTNDAIAWADVIFTAGGDGTFLLGASKIRHRNIPIIGLNTDPNYSVGFLCLPSWCTNNLPKTLDLVLSGTFKYFWRNRIRVSIYHHRDQPLKMSFLDKRKPGVGDGWLSAEHTDTSLSHPGLLDMPLIPADVWNNISCTVLPIAALNEVFVGETLSARVSHYEICIDHRTSLRQKSSGVTIATGTGSTSWYRNITALSPETVAKILRIASSVHSRGYRKGDEILQQQFANAKFIGSSPSLTNQQEIEADPLGVLSSEEFAHAVTQQFNASIQFDPTDSRMAFVVRDPVCNAVFHVDRPHGMASNVQIRSLMLDAHLVFDGGCIFPFQYGSVAEFSIHQSDALCCVSLLDPS